MEMEMEIEIDRLSSLHEPILIDIMSRLPIHSAVATSLLSCPWRHRYTKLNRLVFKYNCFNSAPFFDTVNSILPKFTSPKLDTFCVEFSSLSDLENNKPQSYSSLESWISTCFYRNVEQLEVHVGGRPLRSISSPSIMILPIFIVRCRSLVVLSLKGPFNFDCAADFDVSLPNLNKLYLAFPVLPSKLLAKLFNSCLSLEQLSLSASSIESDTESCLSAPNLDRLQFSIWLKKLELSFHVLHTDLLAKIFNSCQILEEILLSAHSIEGNTDVCICAPNLKKLVISIWEHLPHQAKFVIIKSKIEHLSFCAPFLLPYFQFDNLNALITADICSDYKLRVGGDYLDHLVELVRLISCVSILRLNSATLKHFSDLTAEWNLNSLMKLSIILDANPFPSWNYVLCFLRGSPHLEVLILDLNVLKMKFVQPDYEPPSGLRTLRRVQVLRFRGDSNDLKMMEYILENAPALELLSLDVIVGASTDEYFELNEYQLCCQLFHSRRSSFACEIEFLGRFLKASSKGFNDGAPRCRFIMLNNMEVHQGHLESEDDASKLILESKAEDKSIQTHTINFVHWDGVLNFLRDSSNLEVLRINFDRSTLGSLRWINWDAPEGDPPCGLSFLKKIEITGFGGSSADVKTMNYILKNTQALEVLSLDVCIDDDDDDTSLIRKECHLCWELFHLERSSSACEIEFSGEFLKAYSKGKKNRVRHCRISRLGKLLEC